MGCLQGLGALSGGVAARAVVDVGRVKADPAVTVMVVVVVDEFGHALAACRLVNRSGNAGAYFRVLFHASEYGLSLETLGLEWASSRVATGLLVIAVPRSACTTLGMPWAPKICVISSTANTAASVLWTCAPTMYRE